MFLQHYITHSTLGQKFNISLECLQLEIGSDGCPLSKPFTLLGQLATPCWCRSFWQGLNHYDFDLHLDYPSILHPREGDKLPKDIFLATNPTLSDLRSFSRCRIAWSTLFLSDITTADGRCITQQHMQPPNELRRMAFRYPFAE